MTLDKAVRALIVFILFVLGVTFIAAISNIGDESYDQPIIVKHVPKVEKKIETRTVEKPVQSAQCLELAKVAQRMLTAVDAYEKQLGAETRVQERSYQATTDHSQAEMNKVTEDHRKIIRATLDAALALQEAKKDLESAEKECRSYPQK